MPRSIQRTAFALAALVVMGAAPAAAQVVRPDDRSTFIGIWENDVFAGTDKGYTNGTFLGWQSPSANPPRWLNWIGRHSLFLLPNDGQLRWGLGIGQNIYTPEDIDARIPDPSDRPYAGWLYGAISIVSYAERVRFREDLNVTKFGALELQFGVVGPSALGEQVQNNVHDFINVERALGWDFQLKDQPGANLVLTRLWRVNRPFRPMQPLGLAIGFVPEFTASVGNVQTYAYAGLTVRIGSNLEADFGPPRISPAPAGSGFFQPDGRWGWYAFAGGGGRAVFTDVFLDGNAWRDSPSVDKRHFVGDGVMGVAIVMPWARLAYSHTWRSREFWGQKETPQFGSITLSFRL